jgi:hypothetical protein
MVQRKILVLDLDETLIHSHHDGLVRPTVKPGTPPDFILRVTFSFHHEIENIITFNFTNQHLTLSRLKSIGIRSDSMYINVRMLIIF